MTGKNKSALYYLDTISDACILFVSYVISMFIRYYIMDSDPGLPILSTPYLLVAAVYSVIMACIFSYVQSGNENRTGKDMRLYSKLNGGSGYKILAVNVIGCLFLMSFFFVVGVVYFSRWALVLFWGISSAGIIIKEGIVQNILSKENVRERYGIRTIVVGDGKLAKEYLRSVYTYPSLGRTIVGFVRTGKEGTPGSLLTQYEWEDQSGPACLGDLRDLNDILDRSEADEVILALEDTGMEEAERIIRMVTARGVEVGLVPRYGSLIPAKAPVYEFGDTRVIGLNRKRDRRSQDILWLGLVMSASLLVIMLILNLFGIGELQRISAYEDYKCIVFGIAGVFLYSYLMSCFKGKPWANTKRALTAFLSCTVFSLLYEMVYTSGFHYGEHVASDVRVLFISIAICWCVTGLIRLLEKDFPMSF
ncbi:MAG: hypothetical protein LUI14_02715 [Lachnospiraceae bacterium]|nr:hypothetical protein [Lachnospiraceae bacterium]